LIRNQTRSDFFIGMVNVAFTYLAVDWIDFVIY
jgi:hypothetical protein